MTNYFHDCWKLAIYLPSLIPKTTTIVCASLLDLPQSQHLESHGSLGIRNQHPQPLFQVAILYMSQISNEKGQFYYVSTNGPSWTAQCYEIPPSLPEQEKLETLIQTWYQNEANII